MLTAIVVGGIGVYAMNAAGLTKLFVKPAQLIAVPIGGLIFVKLPPAEIFTHVQSDALPAPVGDQQVGPPAQDEQRHACRVDGREHASDPFLRARGRPDGRRAADTVGRAGAERLVRIDLDLFD